MVVLVWAVVLVMVQVWAFAFHYSCIQFDATSSP